MHLCFSCISYLSFGTEIQGETKPQPCQILTKNNTLDRFVGQIVFAGRGHQVEDFSGMSLYKSAKRGCSMSDMAIWRPFNFTFIAILLRILIRTLTCMPAFLQAVYIWLPNNTFLSIKTPKRLSSSIGCTIDTGTGSEKRRTLRTSSCTGVNFDHHAEQNHLI